MLALPFCELCVEQDCGSMRIHCWRSYPVSKIETNKQGKYLDIDTVDSHSWLLCFCLLDVSPSCFNSLCPSISILIMSTAYSVKKEDLHQISILLMLGAKCMLEYKCVRTRALEGIVVHRLRIIENIISWVPLQSANLQCKTQINTNTWQVNSNEYGLHMD